MHCAVQHKPYAEWHKPCRYYRLLFRNLQAPLPISTAVFCCFRPSSPQSYGTFHRWFPPPFSVDRNAIGPFAVVFRRQASAALTVARLGFSQVSSLRAFIKNRRRDFHRFPWGIEGAMEVALPEAAPLLGRLCFLSVIDGVAPYQNLISDETAWIKAVSLSRLSTVYRMAPGSRSRSLRFRLTICSRSLIHSDWLSR